MDETSVIAEQSPIWPTKQLTKKTEDASIFDFFISGEDSSSVVPPPDIKSEKTKWRAQVDLLESFISGLQEELSEVDEDLESRIESFTERISRASEIVAQNSSKLQEIGDKRRAIWQELSRARTRISQIEQLVARFELLKDHYDSDLERLKFLAEGDFLLSQLGEAHCPMCGGLVEDHDALQQQLESEDGQTIQNATAIESEKLRKHLAELGATIGELQNEAAGLLEENASREREISVLDQEMRETMRPALTASSAGLHQLVSDRSALTAIQNRKKQLADFQQRLIDLGDEPKKKKAPKDIPATAAVTKGRRSFFDVIEARLRSWNFSGVGTVEFDQDQDLVVNGEPRRSHGKGVRAVLQSAFSISLMTESGERHPRFVVLDSPLTSFKAADTYEADEDVQRGLFEELAELSKNQQVIVIENKEPDQDIQETVNYVHFSGVPGEGRSGFFPEAKI